MFVEPQETPFLSSLTENLENTTADDSQTIIHDIQIENERLHKEIHQVTSFKKENFKLEVEELIDTLNQRTRGKSIHNR